MTGVGARNSATESASEAARDGAAATSDISAAMSYAPMQSLSTGDLATVAALAIETTRAMDAFNARRALVPQLPTADARENFMRRLAAEPWNLGFYQAVRRLENFTPEKPRIGHSRRLADDPIRFCQSPSLAFAPATMSGFKHATGNSPPRLFVEFLGLCGPSGPMPLHVTEYLRDRERNSTDPTPARFFDLFNHRMISMFYRAWAINQQTVSFERSLADARLLPGVPTKATERFEVRVDGGAPQLLDWIDGEAAPEELAVKSFERDPRKK